MRIFLPLFLLLILLTGCAVTAPTDDAVTSENNETETQLTRTIVHALGETEITGIPDRVVTLEWSYTEDLLALGMQPAGVADIEGYNSWVKIPVELSDSVVDVGTRQAPNLELLAQLGPDLIIGPAFRIAEIYDELSVIAPTIAFDAYPTDENTTQFTAVKDAFLLIAEIVGRESEGDAVLADMDDHFAAARAQVEAAGKSGEPFILAQAFGDDTVSIRLFTDNAMTAEIVEQIGLENGWSDEEFQLYGFTTVGIETLPDLGDINFFYVVQDDNNVFTRESIQPVWESIEFVQKGNAYPLGGETWLFGGPLSAKVLVDIVVEALTGEPVAAPAERAQLPRDVFPMTIEHKYGSTTIEEQPTRVVSVGYSEHDELLALGVVPVGVRQWYGDYPYEVWPWAQDELGDAEPATIGGAELNFEAIAALNPDLIVGITSGMSEDEYDLLSQIAPTVAQSGDYTDYGTPWPEVSRILGRAVGRSELAEQIVTDLETRFAEVCESHPEFDGATLAVAFAFDGAPGVYSSQDVRPRLLSDLGFVTPEVYDELAGDSFFASFSEERMPELLDVDLIVWLSGSDEGIEEIRNQPLRASLVPAQEGREIFLGQLLGGAFSFSSPLSLSYLLDELVPMLEAAMDGDPNTVVPGNTLSE